MADLAARVRAAGGRVERRPLADGADVLLFWPAGVADRGVAMLHGGGNDRLYGLWTAIEALVGHGHAVATTDLPGHGPGGMDHYSLPAARARVDALCDAMTLALGGGRVALLGQSLGGALALDRLARGGAEPVVAVSVPLALALGPRVLGELATLARPATWRALRGVTPGDALPAFGPFNRARYPVRLAAGTDYLKAFRATLADLNLEARLARRCAAAGSVLLVHGERDAIAPLAHARRLRIALGDRAGWLPVAGAGHFDPLLRPEVLAAIAAWLDRQDRPASVAGTDAGADRPVIR